MIKKYEYKLKNGLRLIIFKNNKLERKTAHFYINVGGNNNNFVFNNKEYKFTYGYAHFLEHYLIEHSIYGNLGNIFRNNYIDTNGVTTPRYTTYYISTVHDFDDNLIKLINMINNPSFDDKNVEETKPAIISEISKNLDNKYLKYYKVINDSIYNTIEYNPTLGSIDDIQKINKDNLELFYNSYYRPSNMMLILTGNINIKNTIKLIEDTFNLNKHDNTTFTDISKIEPIKVNKKYTIYKDPNEIEELNLIYKIDLSKFSLDEKIKIDYYIEFVLFSYLSESSSLFRKLYSEKKIVYSFNTRYTSVVNNIGELDIQVATEYQDEISILINDIITNHKYDSKLFNTWKNITIIDYLNISDNIYRISKIFINNLILYNSNSIENLDFIKSLNIDECNKLLDKIDFTNYTIIKRIKG